MIKLKCAFVWQSIVLNWLISINLYEGSGKPEGGGCRRLTPVWESDVDCMGVVVIFIVYGSIVKNMGD